MLPIYLVWTPPMMMVLLVAIVILGGVYGYRFIKSLLSPRGNSESQISGGAISGEDHHNRDLFEPTSLPENMLF